MSQILDQFKLAVLNDLAQLYKMRSRLPADEKEQFEAWFWKVRPLFTVSENAEVPRKEPSENPTPVAGNMTIA